MSYGEIEFYEQTPPTELPPEPTRRPRTLSRGAPGLSQRTAGLLWAAAGLWAAAATGLLVAPFRWVYSAHFSHVQLDGGPIQWTDGWGRSPGQEP